MLVYKDSILQPCEEGMLTENNDFVPDWVFNNLVPNESASGLYRTSKEDQDQEKFKLEDTEMAELIQRLDDSSTNDVPTEEAVNLTDDISTWWIDQANINNLQLILSMNKDLKPEDLHNIFKMEDNILSGVLDKLSSDINELPEFTRQERQTIAGIVNYKSREQHAKPSADRSVKYSPKNPHNIINKPIKGSYKSLHGNVSSQSLMNSIENHLPAKQLIKSKNTYPNIRYPKLIQTAVGIEDSIIFMPFNDEIKNAYIRGIYGGYQSVGLPASATEVAPVNRIKYLRTNESLKQLRQASLEYADIKYEFKMQTKSKSFYGPSICRILINSGGQKLEDTRQGLCPYCPKAAFYYLKTSAYSQHISYHHGISIHGTYPSPRGWITTSSRGKHKDICCCPVCHEILGLKDRTKNERPFLFYFRHFRTEHTMTDANAERHKHRASRDILQFQLEPSQFKC